jgi:1,2-phenylacetyl-CoA epoxidase catalytic subunit
LNALVDTALTVQFEALTSSSYVPLRNRCEKLLEEERFHTAHGSAWFRRLAGANERAREALREAAQRALPAIVQWFGPDDDSARALGASGVIGATPDELRTRYAERVGGLLELVGLGVEGGSPDFREFRTDMRRPAGTTPEAGVIAKVRGDLNRAFLMD